MPKRIKLLCDLPIHSSHKALKGNEYDVIRFTYGRGAKVFLIGDIGEEFVAYSSEYEAIERK